MCNVHRTRIRLCSYGLYGSHDGQVKFQNGLLALSHIRKKDKKTPKRRPCGRRRKRRRRRPRKYKRYEIIRFRARRQRMKKKKKKIIRRSAKSFQIISCTMYTVDSVYGRIRRRGRARHAELAPVSLCRDVYFLLTTIDDRINFLTSGSATLWYYYNEKPARGGV